MKGEGFIASKEDQRGNLLFQRLLEEGSLIKILKLLSLIPATNYISAVNLFTAFIINQHTEIDKFYTT